MPIFFRNTPLQEPFTLDSAGFDWHQEPWDRPEGYPLYHYLQTEQGCGSFAACGRTYLLTEGDGLLIAPFVPHSYHAEGADWITTFVTFTGTLSDTFPSLIQNKVRFFPSSDTGTIRELIREGADLMAASPVDTAALSVTGYHLMLLLSDKNGGNSAKDHPLYQSYITPALQLIAVHFNEELTASQIAASLHVSQQYLSRLFLRFLGCSVYEYLTFYRISRAKELLLTNRQLQIQVIGQRVGFADASHFTSMFRKLTGMTPRQFRMQ